MPDTDFLTSVARVLGSKRVPIAGVAILVAGYVVTTVAPEGSEKNAAIAASAGVLMLFIYFFFHKLNSFSESQRGPLAIVVLVVSSVLLIVQARAAIELIQAVIESRHSTEPLSETSKESPKVIVSSGKKDIKPSKKPIQENHAEPVVSQSPLARIDDEDSDVKEEIRYPEENCLCSGLCVFPGAEGCGVATKAGRGGRLIRVTNLNADGPGSLHAAVTTKGPRTIIFDVGGYITLEKEISVKEPFVTIAGQTAPSPGITLRGAGMSIQTNDVLFQHLRIRPGDHPSGPAGDLRIGLAVGPDSFNIVIDHVSVSWGINENVSTWYPLHDVTFSNCIISEALHNSLHPDDSHSRGLLIGDKANRVAILRNLLAHNDQHNPRLKGDTTTVVVNNLIYNPGWDSILITDSVGPGIHTIIGNVEINGANTKSTRLLNFSSLWAKSKVYQNDNIGDQKVNVSGPVVVSSPPITLNPQTLLPSARVKEHVLANAGARPLDRDAVDKRIVNDVKYMTGTIIDSPKEVGGWPVMKSTERVLKLPANHQADDDKDGYTNLEEWLHKLATAVEPRPPSVAPPSAPTLL